MNLSIEQGHFRGRLDNGGPPALKVRHSMATERTKTATTLGVLALAALLVVGGLGFLAFKLHAKAAREKALAELKQRNPVEYFILHTAKTQSDDELKNQMVGTWELRGNRNRQAGQFNFIPARSGFLKTWTLTNWSIVTYDFFSNVQYTASGHYTLQGDLYTEAIEAATGQMTQYLGAHPSFRIRLDGDTYYQMSAGKNANPLEEMWQRVQ